MKLQHMIFTLLLLFLGLLDNAFGVTIHANGHPAFPRSPCSYIINGAGFASVICHFPTDAPDGGPSGHAGTHTPDLSYSALPDQINTSWTPVTETYTTTSVDVVHPLNCTQTYTDLSTELTSTTLDMKTATQTIVEIAGYSIIGTHTTTFLAPASSSTYSAIKTITIASSELLVPSSGTLTITGHLPPSVHSFTTVNAQKRGLSWGSAENGTDVLACCNHAKRSTWGNITTQTTGRPAYLTAAAIKPVPSLLDSPIQAASIDEHTQSSSSGVLVITVTNTYSVTPTSEHPQKTISSLKGATSWLIGSLATPNSTQPLPTALTMHNTSAVIHATSMAPETSSSMVHMTSIESDADKSTEVIGTVTPTSISAGSSAISKGLVLHIILAVLAMRLSFVV
ncbi:hypothetical protein N0V93_004282 [Gnomoniopsis smithogilvyi]|uniref:Uncharacterized protein n=1 Tax=Gnomoniopsis smithogilvyi TaxID=1191159 RepID=A0A9W8YR70_9PEZI|nr:hypothetical protein N0V93_004282 [Gnomoniopsis smithogilvyi]